MTWEYRVAIDLDDDCYRLVEVYYKDNKTGWIEASFAGGWENPSEIDGALAKMCEAFSKPFVVIEDECIKEQT